MRRMEGLTSMHVRLSCARSLRQVLVESGMGYIFVAGYHDVQFHRCDWKRHILGIIQLSIRSVIYLLLFVVRRPRNEAVCKVQVHVS